MKKIILILLIINCSLLIAEAQWIQQNSPVNHHLTNIKFANKITGWITTFSGSILKTSNSGLNWLVQYTIPGKYMFGLSVVDSKTVIAVGWFETIIKTTDGGENWTEIKNGPIGIGHSFDAVYFNNKDTGWVAGSGNLIFKTTNGGLTFDSVVVSGRFKDFYFRNTNEGLVCGEGGTIHKTENGGLNWIEIFVPVGSQSADFSNLTFVNYNTGYTLGVQNSKIYKTTNFGLKWDSLTRIPSTGYMNCIFFSNVNIGWSCGDNNQIYKSTDAGIIWKRENTSQFSPWGYGGLYFASDSIGWSVGTAGKIVYTTSSGLTFAKEQFSSIPNNMNLRQNYPNPFNSSTKIKYEIKKLGKYKMEIYNYLGQSIEILFNEIKNYGIYEININAEKLSSGIYFYRLSGIDQYQVNSFLLIK